MYAILKNNICMGINNLPLDEASFTEDEKQIELQDIQENPIMLLGKTYANSKFMETEKTDKEKQLEVNNQKRLFLKETDWKIIRHRDQLDMGIQTSLTDEEYKTLLAERQKTREEVVNVD